MSWGSLTLGYGLKGFLDNSSHRQLSPGALACWSYFSCIFLNFQTVLICCIKSQVFNWENSHVDHGRKSLVLISILDCFGWPCAFEEMIVKISFYVYIESSISLIAHYRLGERVIKALIFEFHTRPYVHVFRRWINILKSDIVYQWVAKI